MKLSDVKLSLCKYRVRNFVLKYGKGQKHVVETSLITKMEIVENFDEELFPFFTITLYVPTQVYRRVTNTRNKNKVTATLNIQKAKFTDAVSMDSAKRPSFSNCITGRFHCVIAAKDVEVTQQEQQIVEKSDNKYGQLKALTLAIYPKSYYDNYQTVVNAVIESCTLTDAMVYVFQNAGLDNMLVSPPDNNKQYKEFKIPPLQAHKLLHRISNTYAYHKKGSVIFFAYDRGYIIKRVTKCTAYETNEIKTTYVAVFTNSKGSMQTGGCYCNQKKKYNVINASELSADNTNSITKKAIGEKTIIVNKDGNMRSTGSGKITNVAIQEEGEWNQQDIDRKIKENSKGISCQLINADLDMVRPNKQFIVSADGKNYKKYNGKYRLLSATHTFQKEGNFFSLHSIISLGGDEE